jgi:gliding motility-associated-like protein
LDGKGRCFTENNKKFPLFSGFFYWWASNNSKVESIIWYNFLYKNVDLYKISGKPTKIMNTSVLLKSNFFFKRRHLFICFILFFSTTVFSQAPVPAFTATPLSGCSPLLVNFTDQSTGATSWVWDLGNGVISNQQNPSTVYVTPGTYTVTLTVSNANGSQTLTKTNYITVNNPPVAEFSASVTSGCFPLRTQFNDLSTPGIGSIVSWSWSFGDGSSSTIQNPQHTYLNSGNYSVTLTVVNSSGCSRTIVKPNYITVSPGVRADFDFTPPVNCSPPELIQFQNLTTGPGTITYQWNFGDGNTSTATSPSNNYLTTGPFTVTLIATSSQGCVDTLVRNNLVQLSNLQTQIDAPDTACVTNGIFFQNLSNPQPVSSLWTFDDGTSSTQTNPVKAYNSPGTYIVKLVNTYSGCADSTTHTIVIVSKPVARFTSVDSISCRAPHTVNFQDQSTGAVSWNWDFGDGGTSTLQNPNHTYTTLDSFTVRLIVTNALGCSDTLVKTNFVRLERPVFNPIITPIEGCRLLNVNFTGNTTSVDSITNWLWDLGNGNTSTLINPTNTYDSGTYNIKLRVTTRLGCIDSITVFNGVRVGTRPTSNFNAVPTTVCAFSPVQFNDLSTGNPNQWLWNFGDGSTSNLQNPTHIFQDTGRFTIRLTAFNNRCPDSITRIAYITVLPPIARFVNAVNCTINKQQVTFTDQSIGATSWLWNFGDGNTSTLQNPVHTYPALGVYTVTLTVFNGTCSHSLSRTIRLLDALPDFSSSVRTACKRYESIQFINQSTEVPNIVSYLWNFGDGTTSTLENPVHIYNNAGNYSVTLSVTDINNCVSIITKNNYIRINGPIAGFSIPQIQNCINTDISFSNTSTSDGINPITAVLWNMTPTVTINSNTNPFIYRYTTEGFYVISQWITDAAGCRDTFRYSIQILNPKANFLSDTLSCPGSVINFTNQSTGGTGSQTYNWVFSDGFTANTTNTLHAFAATGNYTVTLFINEPIGCRDSITKTIQINNPVASFTVNDSASICEPFEVNFTGTSTFVSSVNWNFGDGNTSNSISPTNFYVTPGQYRAQLTVTSPGGCMDSTFKIITMGRDTGTLSYNPLIGCAPLAVTFQTRTDIPLEYTWDYGDGNTITNLDSNSTHQYLAGVYVPKVIIKDRQGCIGIINGLDTIVAFGSRPNFGADQFLFCDSGTVQFTDSTFTLDVITGYQWNFGDGNTSSAINPVHRYSSPGTYNVTLTINTITGCTNSITKNAFIKVVASPIASITGATSSCIPASFQLRGNWLNPDTSAITWRWNIDGQIFNVQNPPPINRASADTVFAELILTNSSGCRDTVTDIAIARPLPIVSAGNDTTICLGSFATLNPSGAASYTWSPATYLSCTNCTNPQSAATDNIQYTVTGTSSFGCNNSDNVIVRVKKPFRITASPGDTLCIGETYRMQANGADFYSWTPPFQLSSTNTASTIASPTNTTVYKVVGTDSLNCFSDSAFVPIVVYNYPIIGLRDTTIRAGDTILLNPQVSSDVTNLIWQTNYNLSCTNCITPLAWPERTTSYRVTATNQGGCETTRFIKVNVICGKENIFVPNAFTPDGNGLNDRFTILGRGLQSILFLRIYNRWGNLVFEKSYFDANNPSLGWDGKINGKEATPGLYSYTAQIICGEGSILPVNGNVLLIR